MSKIMQKVKFTIHIQMQGRIYLITALLFGVCLATVPPHHVKNGDGYHHGDGYDSHQKTGNTIHGDGYHGHQKKPGNSLHGDGYDSHQKKPGSIHGDGYIRGDGYNSKHGDGYKSHYYKIG